MPGFQGFLGPLITPLFSSTLKSLRLALCFLPQSFYDVTLFSFKVSNVISRVIFFILDASTVRPPQLLYPFPPSHFRGVRKDIFLHSFSLQYVPLPQANVAFKWSILPFPPLVPKLLKGSPKQPLHGPPHFYHCPPLSHLSPTQFMT